MTYLEPGWATGFCFLWQGSPLCRKSRLLHLALCSLAWSLSCRSQCSPQSSESIGHLATSASTSLEHRRSTSGAHLGCSRRWPRPLPTPERCSHKWRPPEQIQVLVGTRCRHSQWIVTRTLFGQFLQHLMARHKLYNNQLTVVSDSSWNCPPWYFCSSPVPLRHEKLLGLHPPLRRRKSWPC